MGSLLLTALLGLFLGLLLGTVLAGSSDFGAIRAGIVWMAVAQSLGFAWDLMHIRQRSVAWVRSTANEIMSRIKLLHIGMLGGLFVMGVMGGRPPAFFGTFAFAKLSADLVVVLVAHMPDPPAPGQAPAWVTRWLDRLDPEGKLTTSYREHMARASGRAEVEKDD